MSLPILLRSNPQQKGEKMIDKVHVLDVIHSKLEGSDKFLVDLKITTDNRIYVSVDGDNGITIDDCIELSRAIEGSLNREEEDFELNVASAGLDSPLKLQRQYKKNVGRELTVTFMDGEQVEGRLESAEENGITLQTAGTKKTKGEILSIPLSDIKTAKVIVKF